MTDSTKRFSNRVGDYLAARPHYPDRVVRHLESIGALGAGGRIVDVGAGTGLSSEPFLRLGYDVTGVEPNAEMRAAGQKYLEPYERYRAVNGTAEATTLTCDSADLWIAGQAFHWFEPLAARHEATRILRAGKWAALLWNDRQTSTAFLAAYEALLEASSDTYRLIRQRHASNDAIATFMAGEPPLVEHFAHARWLPWDGLLGLTSSASYMPAPGTAEHDAVVRKLRLLYDRHASDAGVEIRYVCRVYAAPLPGSGGRSAQLS